MDRLIGFSALFVLTHMFLSAYPVRRSLVNKAGVGPFLVAYSLIAGTLFWGLMSAYLDAPQNLMWQPPMALRHLPISVMPLCCVFIIAGYTTANPAAVGADKIVVLTEQPRGIFRVTRHPVLWAVGLWAMTHLMASGDSAAMVLFGTLIVLALAGSIHMDYRKSLQCGAAWKEYLSRTSSIPFLAIVQGRQKFLWRELGPWRIAGAIVLYVGLLVFHGQITGVSPLPMPTDM